MPLKDPMARKAYNRRHYQENKDRWRDTNYRRLYKISLREWNELFMKQGRRCACCKSYDPGGQRWATDHCHQSGKVRSILCNPCNSVLGFVEGDPSRLQALGVYLEAYCGREED